MSSSVTAKVVCLFSLAWLLRRQPPLAPPPASGRDDLSACKKRSDWRGRAGVGAKSSGLDG